MRRRAGDAFAERVFSGLNDADTVRIEGPRGEFVLDEESNRPLIFLACDTGFAPIKSLLEHAMALDAAETLDLYWIASGQERPLSRQSVPLLERRAGQLPLHSV